MGSGFHFEEGEALVTINGPDIPVFLAVMAAALALEIFLSLKKDGRLGLVLPGLWLIWRVGVLLSRVAMLSAEGRLSNYTGRLFLALLVENLPTLLLLLACGACRLGKRWKTIGQLKKTRIQDL